MSNQLASELDALIESDPDAAERLIEKHLARIALKKRLAARQALAAHEAVKPEPSQLSVYIERKQVWIKRGTQFFRLAYEAETEAEREWYAGQLRKALAAPVAVASPLSDEQIRAALGSVTHEVPARLPVGWKNFARAIEAAHDIKEMKP